MRIKKQLSFGIQKILVLVAISALVLAPTASALTNTIAITGSMEGNLAIKAGDTVRAGYDFKLPGKHPAVTITVSGTVRVFEDCGTITITLPTQTYNVAKDFGDWIPSKDQSNPATYQGSTIATCTGHDPKGATFTGTFTWSSAKCLETETRFHYSDNSAGSWSAAVDANEPEKCVSAPCTCQGEQD